MPVLSRPDCRSSGAEEWSHPVERPTRGAFLCRHEGRYPSWWSHLGVRRPDPKVHHKGALVPSCPVAVLALLTVDRQGGLRWSVPWCSHVPLSPRFVTHDDGGAHGEPIGRALGWSLRCPWSCGGYRLVVVRESVRWSYVVSSLRFVTHDGGAHGRAPRWPLRECEGRCSWSCWGYGLEGV